MTTIVTISATVKVIIHTIIKATKFKININPTTILIIIFITDIVTMGHLNKSFTKFNFNLMIDPIIVRQFIFLIIITIIVVIIVIGFFVIIPLVLFIFIIVLLLPILIFLFSFFLFLLTCFS